MRSENSHEAASGPCTCPLSADRSHRPRPCPLHQVGGASSPGRGSPPRRTPLPGGAPGLRLWRTRLRTSGPHPRPPPAVPEGAAGPYCKRTQVRTRTRAQKPPRAGSSPGAGAGTRWRYAPADSWRHQIRWPRRRYRLPRPGVGGLHVQPGPFGGDVPGARVLRAIAHGQLIWPLAAAGRGRRRYPGFVPRESWPPASASSRSRTLVFMSTVGVYRGWLTSR
jgi:hypothetical protein